MIRKKLAWRRGGVAMDLSSGSSARTPIDSSDSFQQLARMLALQAQAQAAPAAQAAAALAAQQAVFRPGALGVGCSGACSPRRPCAVCVAMRQALLGQQQSELIRQQSNEQRQEEEDGAAQRRVVDVHNDETDRLNQQTQRLNQQTEAAAAAAAAAPPRSPKRKKPYVPLALRAKPATKIRGLVGAVSPPRALLDGVAPAPARKNAARTAGPCSACSADKTSDSWVSGSGIADRCGRETFFISDGAGYSEAPDARTGDGWKRVSLRGAVLCSACCHSADKGLRNRTTPPGSGLEKGDLWRIASGGGYVSGSRSGGGSASTVDLSQGEAGSASASSYQSKDSLSEPEEGESSSSSSKPKPKGWGTMLQASQEGVLVPKPGGSNRSSGGGGRSSSGGGGGGGGDGGSGSGSRKQRAGSQDEADAFGSGGNRRQSIASLVKKLQSELDIQGTALETAQKASLELEGKVLARPSEDGEIRGHLERLCRLML